MINRAHAGAGCTARGVALIVVLWALVLGGVVLVSVQQATRVTAAVGYNQLSSVQAHWLARAGVEQAVAELVLDDEAVASMLDYWYEDPAVFEAVALGTGRFSVVAPGEGERSTRAERRYGIEDLAARLNVNTADAQSLQRLDLLDEAQIAAILDWREPGDEVRPGGAGYAHYQGLTYPYAIRNGPLHTLKELRLVRGIDEQTYFGEGSSPAAMLFPAAHTLGPVNRRGQDPRALGLARLATVHSAAPNVTRSGDQPVNVNQVDVQTMRSMLLFSAELAEAVVQAREFDSLFELLDVQPSSSGPGGPGRGQPPPGSGPGRGEGGADNEDADEDTIDDVTLEWLAENWDQLTLTDDDHLPGRINLNTASRLVLMTLPGVEASVANAIVAHRGGAGGPFTSVGQLLQLREVDEALFRDIAERLSVTSSVFRITSIGVSHRGMRQQIVAIVDRGRDPIRILYWYQIE